MKDLVKQYNKIKTIKQWYLNQIQNLSNEELNRKPSDKEWSIAEVCYHCYLVENETIKLINKNLKENKVSKNATIENWIKNKLTVLVLQLGLKIKAPKIMSEFPMQISKQDIISHFKNNEETSVYTLKKIPQSLYHKQIFKHPMAGQFNIYQTLNFLEQHYNHHKPQIKTLLSNL